MEIVRIPTGPFAENTYLACAEGRDDAVLIDPGDDVDAIRRAISASGRRVCAIYLTHFHFDHTISATIFRDESGCGIYISPLDMEYLEDPVANAYAHDQAISSLPAPGGLTPLPYGDEMDFAGLRFRVIPTPGHSRGSVCLYESSAGDMFTGDTLFAGGIGRMDLTGASMQSMRTSLRTLFAMDPSIRIHPGHGEGSTIGAERGRYGL